VKRRDIVLVMTLFGLLFVAFSGCFGAAWYNHGAGYHSPTLEKINLLLCSTRANSAKENPVDYYMRFYIAGDSAFYGTHDYITHFALDYFNQDDITNKHSWLYNKQNRKFYAFLLATEYPDYQGTSAPPFSLDCGKSTQVHLDFHSESHDFINCRKKANLRGDKAITYLNKKDDEENPKPWAESAAFYLGAMTHYIAEMAHPGHAGGAAMGWSHKWFEQQVCEVTTLNDYTNNGDNTFFEIDLTEKLGWSPIINGIKVSYSPWTCVDKLALITRDNKETDFNGNKGTGEYNGTYLDRFEYDELDRFLFSEVDRNSPKYKSFFDRIEILLNWAVYYTACAIKYCLKNFDGQNTECTPNKEEEPEREYFPPGPWFPRDLADLLARYGLVILVGIISYLRAKGALR